MSCLSISRKREQSSPSIKSSHCIFFLFRIFFCFLFSFCLVVFLKFPSFASLEISLIAVWRQKFVYYIFWGRRRRKKLTGGEVAFTSWRSISLFSPCLFSFLRFFSSSVYMTRAVICICFLLYERTRRAHPVTFSSQHPLRIFTVCQRERERDAVTKTSHCIDTPLFSAVPLSFNPFYFFPFVVPTILPPGYNMHT